MATQVRQLGYRGCQVLEYVAAEIRRSRRAPSYSMIADELDMTVPHVHRVVRRLERRGFLKRRDVSARQLRGWNEPVIELRS